MNLGAAGISIRKARWIGPARRARGPGWVMVGQDGAQSIRCGESVLFFFSDTLLVLSGRDRLEQSQPAPPPVRAPEGMQTVFLANCAGLSEHADIGQALSTIRYFPQNDGLPREILSPDKREQFRKLRFWPEHGVCIGGRVYFYYLGIQTTNPDSIWGFRVLGTGLAVLDPRNGLCERATYRGDWIFWRNETDDLHYGVQVLAVEDWIYVFGSCRRGLETQAVLARVRPADLLDGNAYQYLSSAEPAWTSDPAGAALLGPASSEYSVGYNEYLGKYTLFYLDGYNKTLHLRLADCVWGPYTEPMPVFRIPAKDSSELVYLGFEHETFRRDGGRSVSISCCEPYFSLPSLLTLTFERNGRTPGDGHLDAG